MDKTGAVEFDDANYLSGGTRVLADKAPEEEKIEQIPVNKIRPNRFQPRITFRKEPLQELANSILDKGVKQPIRVRRVEESGSEHLFEIISGERRWRASQLAGKSHIPAIIVIGDDTESRIEALTENTQREDLTFFETMKAYCGLREVLGTTEQVVARTGKSKRTVERYIKIAKDVADVPDLYELMEKQSAMLEYKAAEILADAAGAIKRLEKKDRREYDRTLRKLGKDGINACKDWLTTKFIRGKNDKDKASGSGYLIESGTHIILSVRVKKGGHLSQETLNDIMDAIGVFSDKLMAASAFGNTGETAV